MEAYTSLARIYDVLMDNVDTAAWCKFISEKLRAHGVTDGLICELGCGTGNMTESLLRAGYDMIGIDASADMLAIAQEKQFRRAAEHGEASEPDILYLQQDMCAFELYGTVRAIVSVCDCINYLTTEEALRQTFRLVNNYLDPGGLFLFDINTPAKYEKIGDDTIAENREEGSFIWENGYDAATRLNTYDLTLFLPEEAGRERKPAQGSHSGPVIPFSGAKFTRYEETHIQRAWTADEIREALRDAGLELLECAEAYTGRAANERTERVFFLAREIEKSRTEKEER